MLRRVVAPPLVTTPTAADLADAIVDPKAKLSDAAKSETLSIRDLGDLHLCLISANREVRLRSIHNPCVARGGLRTAIVEPRDAAVIVSHKNFDPARLPEFLEDLSTPIRFGALLNPHVPLHLVNPLRNDRDPRVRRLAAAVCSPSVPTPFADQFFERLAKFQHGQWAPPLVPGASLFDDDNIPVF